ncbi:MAG: caspase family protein, partial [Bradyrhizobium sp.]
MRCLVHYFALLICLLPVPALAEQQRFALVIGNDIYPNLPPQLQLKKAVNDARAIGDALQGLGQGLGFTVLRSTNASRPEILRQLSVFRQSLHPGDLALIYFSGHGVSIDGANWLLPSDIPGKGDADLITSSAISESELEKMLTKAGVKTGVLIIDACRDNPFAASGNRSVGVARGLARADDPPGGVFKLFSAGTGEKAVDRLSDNDPNPNSIFTRTLLPELTKPGQRLIDVAYAVKGKVADLAASIGEQQHPAQYDGGFAGLAYLAGEAPSTPSAPPASAALPVPDACAKA